MQAPKGHALELVLGDLEDAHGDADVVDAVRDPLRRLEHNVARRFVVAHHAEHDRALLRRGAVALGRKEQQRLGLDRVRLEHLLVVHLPVLVAREIVRLGRRLCVRDLELLGDHLFGLAHALRLAERHHFGGPVGDLHAVEDTLLLRDLPLADLEVAGFEEHLREVRERRVRAPRERVVEHAVRRRRELEPVAGARGELELAPRGGPRLPDVCRSQERKHARFVAAEHAQEELVRSLLDLFGRTLERSEAPLDERQHGALRVDARRSEL
eukprot:Amastigsp_a510479_16.p2 type:complete len:269 gc:universal Amastigsp_a510479_16:871-1677(+)